MVFISTLCCISIILGLVLVASNPSPYFAALGLVLVAGSGCGVLMVEGGSFLALILFLIYLGGMLVVFAYSAALAAEPYPEAWMSRSVFFNMCVYLGLVVGGFLMVGGKFTSCWDGFGFGAAGGVVRGDMGGVALMYSSGGGMLVTSAWVLLLTLFVVLELTRGVSRGVLRAV
uniref:NADH-ubiquinone oxidoreductase chain 6 n=1 Tax=Repomucenus curvicornis TaxID=1503337 RepID=J7M5X1_9TELE|nr:NADH dehydrogenase subunit 6 [Repomucenus curvicornis]BAM36933.1 NADH dehydrogenase subunit 6 [Repomucenus curvicornis]